MSSTVFHQRLLPTGAARCVLFSQISSEMSLLLVANCSLLLQLSLDFFFGSVFTRGLNNEYAKEVLLGLTNVTF